MKFQKAMRWLGGWIVAGAFGLWVVIAIAAIAGLLRLQAAAQAGDTLYASDHMAYVILAAITAVSVVGIPAVLVTVFFPARR